MSGPLKPPDEACVPPHDVSLEIVNGPLPCLKREPLPETVPLINVPAEPVTFIKVLLLKVIGPTFKLPAAALKIDAPIIDMGALIVSKLAELFTTPMPFVNVRMLPLELILKAPALVPN